MVTILYPLYFVAMKVHISESTKKLLDTFTNFETEPRGEVVLKVTVVCLSYM